VVGVEMVQEAVRDAIKNAEENKVPYANLAIEIPSSR